MGKFPNFIWINPRLCRGDSQSLTFAGAYESFPLVNRSRFTERKVFVWMNSKLREMRGIRELVMKPILIHEPAQTIRGVLE
jgi:hypothetical protein